jgi:hypothetical protein
LEELIKDLHLSEDKIKEKLRNCLFFGYLKNKKRDIIVGRCLIGCGKYNNKYYCAIYSGSEHYYWYTLPGLYDYFKIIDINKVLEDCVSSFAKKIGVNYTNNYNIYKRIYISPFGRNFYADRN